MSFTVPTFNLTCNIWHGVAGQYQDYTLPSLSPICNLAWGRRVMFPFDSFFNGTTMNLLLPALTDIRQSWSGGITDLVECPAGSRRFYSVIGVDDSGKGFANEHRIAILDNAFAGVLFVVQGLLATPFPLP
jgi:hypothetical protein